MKELSIEEKAKRYDEALKVLHKYDGANIMFSQSLKEEMFPELTESKDDSIRKTLIAVVNLYYGEGEDEEKAACLNWLEKQGEKGTNGNEREIPFLDWNKRDELMLEESIGFIKSSPYPYAGDTLRGEISKTEVEDWLKSLKDRIQLQTKQEWSKKDRKFINDIECSLLSYKIIVMDNDIKLANYIEKEINWIESLISKLHLEAE